MTIKSYIVSKCGGFTAVAKMLGITQSAVSQWRDYVPAHHQAKLIDKAKKKGIDLTYSDFFEVPDRNN